MKLRTYDIFSWILVAVLAALYIWCKSVGDPQRTTLLFLMILVFVVMLVLGILFNRCPCCSGYLYRRHFWTKYCPHCGASLYDE